MTSLLKMAGQATVMAMLFLHFNSSALAQNRKSKFTVAKKGPLDFPRLKQATIPNAPVLGKPMLVMGEKHPVKAQGNGWASPEFFDVNGDGLKDLLIGEFGSGVESLGLSVGNFIRVYQNEGTATAPKFSDDYDYLEGYEEVSKGTPLSVFTWCCLPFTPRIVDLNDDGLPDIATGQYNPGFVTWFKGSPKGFLPGEHLEQDGNPITSITDRSNYSSPATDITGQNYWNFSSVAFGDFDGDGDQDMVIGGSALRISENTGTKKQPRFGKRHLLLDISGKPLTVASVGHRGKNDYPLYGQKSDAGSYTTVPYVADWNNDGVPDLFATEMYAVPGRAMITYFQGVSTPQGIRFHEGISLLNTEDGGKEFPGSVPHICVTDWNNDGVNDLLIGMKVALLEKKFDPELSWDWDIATGTHKLDPGYYSPAFLKLIDGQLKYAKKLEDSTGKSSAQLKKEGKSNVADLFENYFLKEEYRSLIHEGYLYLMMGRKEN